MSHNLTSDYDAIQTEAQPKKSETREPTALPTGQHANADVLVSEEGNIGMIDLEGRDIADGPEDARAYGEDGTLEGTEEEPDGSDSYDPDDADATGQQLASRKAGITGKGAGLAGMRGISGEGLEKIGIHKKGEDAA